ncbi:MAG: DUF6446 family protein [Paracoccaceae bacterium]|jgi:hypothetical protein
MTGKLLALSIILAAMVAGISIYYLQIYAFYDEVVADGKTDVVLTRRGDGAVTPIAYQDFQAIDSSSSPIRYRACFKTSEPLAALQSKFVTLETAEPLVAPKWFDCFDAAFLGAQIEQGKARAFLAVENLTYGIDRIVTILPDGRGYAWTKINRCGKVVFDGKTAPEDCPKPVERD